MAGGRRFLRLFSFTSFTSLPKTLQLRHLPHRQRPKLPRSHIQHQRPQLYALDFLYQKTHALKHPPNLPVSSFDQNHLVPGIRSVLRQPYFRRRSLHPRPILQLNRNSRSQTRDRPLVRLSADFHQVRLRRVRTGLHQLLRQRPIIRHQQQSFAGVVQPPHRINPFGTILHQLHHRRPSLRIAHGSHITFRLVHHKIQQPLPSFQRRPIHANHVAPRITLSPLSPHNFPIERPPPRRNNLLRLAPRRNPASRHNFLQSFRSHGKKQPYSGGCAVFATSSPATSRNSFLAPARRFCR